MKKLADISSFERLQDQAHRDMGLVSDMSVFNAVSESDVRQLLPATLYGKIFKGVLDNLSKHIETTHGNEFEPEQLRSFLNYQVAHAFSDWYASNRRAFGPYVARAKKWLAENYPAEQYGDEKAAKDAFVVDFARVLDVPETFRSDVKRIAGEHNTGEIKKVADKSLQYDQTSWEREFGNVPLPNWEDRKNKYRESLPRILEVVDKTAFTSVRRRIAGALIGGWGTAWF